MSTRVHSLSSFLVASLARPPADRPYRGFPHRFLTRSRCRRRHRRREASTFSAFPFSVPCTRATVALIHTAKADTPGTRGGEPCVSPSRNRVGRADRLYPAFEMSRDPFGRYFRRYFENERIRNLSGNILKTMRLSPRYFTLKFDGEGV